MIKALTIKSDRPPDLAIVVNEYNEHVLSILAEMDFIPQNIHFLGYNYFLFCHYDSRLFGLDLPQSNLESAPLPLDYIFHRVEYLGFPNRHIDQTLLLNSSVLASSPSLISCTALTLVGSFTCSILLRTTWSRSTTDLDTNLLAELACKGPVCA